MDIFRYKTKGEVVARAGRQMSDLVRRTHGNSVLLLFSGGSSLDIVESIDSRVLGAHVTITMLDERYTRDPSMNNFAQFANRPLYQEGKKKEARYIDTRVNVRVVNKEEVVETMEELTIRLEKSLRKWKNENPKGQVVALQGIAEDGHTAGIMPYPLQRERFEELFEKPARWVVGYDVRATSKKTEDSSLRVDKEKLKKSPRTLKVFPGDRILFRGNSPLFRGPDPFLGAMKSLWSSRLSAVGGVYPLRVTVTLPFLRDMVDHSVVYAVGKNKRAVLERVIGERTRIWEVPARIIHQMKHVTVFTDIS